MIDKDEKNRSWKIKISITCFIVHAHDHDAVHCKLYDTKATYEGDAQNENNKMYEGPIVHAHTLRKLDYIYHPIGKTIAFVVYDHEQ